MKDKVLRIKNQLLTRCEHGDLAEAARRCGVTRHAFYQWIEKEDLSRVDARNLAAIRNVIAERELPVRLEMQMV